MLSRLERWAIWLVVAGLGALLAGLVWDLAVHRLAPEATAHEEVLAPGNPGHHLFAAGLAVLVAGFCLLAVTRLLQRPPASLSGLALAGALPVVVGLACAALALGATATHPEGTGEVVGAVEVEEHAHAASLGTGHEHQQQADAASPVPSLPGVEHPHGTGVPITAQQLLATAELVQRAREAARRYEDVRVAEAEGYRMTTRTFLYHYVNPTYYLDNRTLDVDRIESLVYARGPDGSLKLVGVMFMVRPGLEPPDFGGPLTGWHLHDNLCINPSTWMVEALSDSPSGCPRGTVHVVTGQMLHVWLVDTPAGVFADAEQVIPYLLRLGYRFR
jgi:hypothetical protein